MCEHCISSPGQAAVSSPISSSDTSRSVLLSGTPTAAPCSESEPPRDGSLACTCTRETFGCGIHPSGRAEWIASQRASLVRISRVLDEEQESEALAQDSGQKFFELPRLFSLGSFSSRTAPPSVHEAVKFSSKKYEHAATWFDVGRLLRRKLGRLTAAIGGGCLPIGVTLTRSDATGGRAYRKPPRRQGGFLLKELAGGPLSPRYHEWRMGFPGGWTESKRLGTLKSRSKPRSRGGCSEGR
jgi:hypothetical protein